MLAQVTNKLVKVVQTQLLIQVPFHRQPERQPPQKRLFANANLYSGYNGIPGYPPEEMCKVLIAGSDEQLASARWGSYASYVNSHEGRTENQVFQRFKRILTFFTSEKNGGVFYISTFGIFKKSKIFQANLEPTEPSDADSLQGAGGIPGG